MGKESFHMSSWSTVSEALTMQGKARIPLKALVHHCFLAISLHTIFVVVLCENIARLIITHDVPLLRPTVVAVGQLHRRIIQMTGCLIEALIIIILVNQTMMNAV